MGCYLAKIGKFHMRTYLCLNIILNLCIYILCVYYDLNVRFKKLIKLLYFVGGFWMLMKLYFLIYNDDICQNKLVLLKVGVML